MKHPLNITKKKNDTYWNQFRTGFGDNDLIQAINESIYDYYEYKESSTTPETKSSSLKLSDYHEM